MNVLLIGEILSENLGDQLIYRTTRMLLEQNYSDMNFLTLDIMGRKTHLDLNDKEKRKTKSKLSKIKNIVKTTSVGDYAIKYFSAKKKKQYYEEIINNQN